MNLEAIALRRAQEQAETFRWQPEAGERPTMRRPIATVDAIHRVRCICGNCRTCRNRVYMRAFRNGTLEHPVCDECGKRLHGTNTCGWCARCRDKRPGKFRRYIASRFTHGGGI